MVKKNKFLNKLFGDELINVMCSMLADFATYNYDEDDILNELKKFNESFRMAMYLLALENNIDSVANKINRVNNIINITRKEDFIEAYEEGKAEEFLKNIEKVDKISLLKDLGVDVSLEKRMKLPKEKLDYYRIISNSIMLDQELDNRDGIDTFLTYKKEDN